MQSGENLAQQKGEVERDGGLGSGDSDRPATASLLQDNEDLAPSSAKSGEREHDHTVYYSHASTRVIGRESTEACDSSPSSRGEDVAKAVHADDAQDRQPTTQARANDHSQASAVPEILREALDTKDEKASPSSGALSSQPGQAVDDMEAPPQLAHVSCNTRTCSAKATEVVFSEGVPMGPKLGHTLEYHRHGKAEAGEPELGRVASTNVELADQHIKSPKQQQNLGVSDTEPSQEVMAGSSAPKPSVSAPLCEGDTTLLQDFLPPGVVDGLFEQLCEEVQFKTMRHQGSEVPRWVAVQGVIDPDGTQPVYRHPSDESPPLEAFTPAVQLIRGHVERQLGHPVNHVLIQCYRNSNDYISEHSDKTLDIFRWSYIANVSIGAMRTMVFRTKRGDKNTGLVDAGPCSGSSTPLEAIDRASTMPVDILKALRPVKRRTTRCPMPHNSLIKMGLVTNEKWLHGIKPDKRPQSEKTAAELAWNGTRISLTFRYIATFLSHSTVQSSSSEPLIWGQGAVSKTREHARPVLNGQTPEAVAMLRAFGRENNSPDFDWEANYGCGFDVLHMKASPRYFGCGDVVVDARVRIMLAECGVKYARGDIGIDVRQQSLDRSVRGAATGEVLPVRFVVDDADRTTVVGDIAILLFLDAKHPRKKGADMEIATVYSRFHAALALEQRWKSIWGSAPHSRRSITLLKPHLTELEKWATDAARGSDLEPNIADCALWPVLYDIALAWKSLARGRGLGHTVFAYLGLPALDAYYREFGGRSSVAGVFGVDVVASVLPEPGLWGDDESEEDEAVKDADKSPGKGRPP